MKGVASRFELRKILVNDREVIYQDPLLVLKYVVVSNATILSTLLEDSYALMLEVHVKEKAQELEALDLRDFKSLRGGDSSRWHISYMTEDCRISFRYSTPEDPNHRLDVFFCRNDDFTKVVQEIAAQRLSYPAPSSQQPLPRLELQQRWTDAPIIHPHRLQIGSLSQLTRETVLRKMEDTRGHDLPLVLPYPGNLGSLPPRPASSTSQVSNGNRNSHGILPPSITPSPLSAGYPHYGVRVKSNGRPHSSQSLDCALYRTGLSSNPGLQSPMDTIDSAQRESMAATASQEVGISVLDHRNSRNPQEKREQRRYQLRSGSISTSSPAIEPPGRPELPPTRQLPFLSKIHQPHRDGRVFNATSPYFPPQNNIRPGAPTRQDNNSQQESTKGTEKIPGLQGGSCSVSTRRFNSGRSKDSGLSWPVSNEGPSLLASRDSLSAADPCDFQSPESRPALSDTTSHMQDSMQGAEPYRCSEVKDTHETPEWAVDPVLISMVGDGGSKILGVEKRTMPVGRARSEHPPRRENHTQNLLFYTPSSSAEFGTAKPASQKSTDLHAEMNNEPDGHLMKAVEEAIIRTAAHQDLFWKTRASWEEKSEDCMAAMSLGKHALLEMARKVGVEWAAHVARDMEIATGKAYNQIKNTRQ
ncbi:hypothetical protein GQ53DRAFT_504654 [Thozetella sp. PMI_491]|nr:hypothetical protein GQ53DRAFT_504654 [Thozetella sp. PMI_491]